MSLSVAATLLGMVQNPNDNQDEQGYWSSNAKLVSLTSGSIATLEGYDLAIPEACGVFSSGGVPTLTREDCAETTISVTCQFC